MAETQLFFGAPPTAAERAAAKPQAKLFFGAPPTAEDKATSAKPLSWGDVGQQAVKNLGASAYGTAQAFAEPFIHPVKTAEAFGETALGEANKVQDWALGAAAPQLHAEAAKQYPQLAALNANSEKYADAMNAYFGRRYTSVDGFKKAVATDPVGVAADISMFASMGGDALVRAPGLVGKVGEIARAAGDFTNPVAVAGKAAGKAAKFAGSVIGHVATHAGGPTLNLAAKAGQLGGKASEAFVSHMRGPASLKEIVDSAKTAVQQLRVERGTAYRSGMAQVSGDQTVLNFNDIDKAMMDVDQVKHYKLQDLSPETAGVRKQVKDKIEYWKSLEPGEYHTPEGFDALKQQIHSLAESFEDGSPARVIADQAYYAIRDTIARQTPVYAKVMKDYEEASSELREMQKTLSLNKGATVDTAGRKLLSILRNNLYTNYGRRAELGKVLEEHGAPNLPYQLAGEASKSWVPRGLGAAEAGVPMLMAASGQPKMLAALPFMSPRLMGEVAHGIGKASTQPILRRTPLAAQVARVLGSDRSPQDWTGNAQDVASYLGVPVTTEETEQQDQENQ